MTQTDGQLNKRKAIGKRLQQVAFGGLIGALGLLLLVAVIGSISKEAIGTVLMVGSIVGIAVMVGLTIQESRVKGVTKRSDDQ